MVKLVPSFPVVFDFDGIQSILQHRFTKDRTIIYWVHLFIVKTIGLMGYTNTGPFILENS